MEKVFYNKEGKATAYLAQDYRGTIYRFDGVPVAYLFEGSHIYGINGRHLGWYKDERIYDQDGARVGFTSATCPVPIGKTPPRTKEAAVDEIRPRWSAPPPPKLGFHMAAQELADFLNAGAVSRWREPSSQQE